MKFVVPGILALLLLLLCSCASVGPGFAPAEVLAPVASVAQDEDSSYSSDQDSSYYSDQDSSYYSITNDSLGPIGQGVEVFGQYLELDDIDLDTVFSDGTLVDGELEDEVRKRYGVRYVAGTEHVDITLGAFLEEFLSDDFDNVGFGIGLRAQPQIGKSGNSPVIADIRAKVNYVRGDINVEIRDPGTGAVSGISENDLDYINFEGRFGFAIDFGGLRPGVGLYLDHIDGELDTPFEDADVEGTNAGVYAGLSFLDPSCPFSFDASGHFGDVKGVMASVGLRF